jgi:hypothetical protein
MFLKGLDERKSEQSSSLLKFKPENIRSNGLGINSGTKFKLILPRDQIIV